MYMELLKNISNENTKRLCNINLITDERERNYQIALWVIESLDDLRRKPLPTPPSAYTEYKNSPPKIQAKIRSNESFWRRSDVYKYINDVSRINAENRSNTDWLKGVIDWLPENDILNREKLKDKLHELDSRAQPQTEVHINWEDEESD